MGLGFSIQFSMALECEVLATIPLSPEYEFLHCPVIMKPFESSKKDFCFFQLSNVYSMYNIISQSYKNK